MVVKVRQPPMLPPRHQVEIELRHVPRCMLRHDSGTQSSLVLQGVCKFSTASVLWQRGATCMLELQEVFSPAACRRRCCRRSELPLLLTTPAPPLAASTAAGGGADVPSETSTLLVPSSMHAHSMHARQKGMDAMHASSSICLTSRKPGSAPRRNFPSRSLSTCTWCGLQLSTHCETMQ